MKERCNFCGKYVETECSYELQKLRGSDAGHWFLCGDLCLYLWLAKYNPLIKLVALES